MPGGRPTKYTKELGIKICSRIAEGESVRSIIKDNEMPSSSTIFNWLLDEDKKQFLEHYEIARNVQAETMFEELLEIADETPHEEINKARLRVDTRKWYLSKVLPKKFGDKMDLTSGNKPIPIMNVNVLRNNSNKEDSEIDEEG
jgi:hypothetical protein